MSTRLGLVGPLAAAVILVGNGCMPPTVPRYVEPSPEAPHALVMVSTSFSSQPGSFVDHDVNIDGRKIALAKGEMKQSDSAVRVAPGQVRWTFASRFYHFETRQVLENVQYSDSEYDSCAHTDYKGRCEGGYRTVTKSRLETRSKTVEVDDASCVAADGFVLDAARTYRVAYTFVAENQCAVKCSDVTDRDHEVSCATRPTPATPSTTVATSTPPTTTTAPSSVQGTAAAPATATPAPAAPKKERPLAPLGVGLVAAGGIGLITAGAAAALALNDRETVRKHCDANATCDAEGLAAARQGSTASTVATTSVGVGGALLAAGIGVLLWGPTREVPRASVSASANGAELRIGGTF